MSEQLPHRIEVVFVSPGGVVTRQIGTEMLRVRGTAFLLGSDADDDLLAEIGMEPRRRVPWESREARLSAIRRIATGEVCGSTDLEPGACRSLLEHIASTPFLHLDE